MNMQVRFCFVFCFCFFFLLLVVSLSLLRFNSFQTCDRNRELTSFAISLVKNKNINFLKNEKRFEICRSFAAMLQLVNDGKLNVNQLQFL